MRAVRPKEESPPIAMRSHGCMDFFLFTFSPHVFSSSLSRPDEKEEIAAYLDDAARLSQFVRAAVVVQARARGKRARDALLLRSRLVTRLQAIYRARATRATPLARSLRRFLVERRRSMALERALGHVP